MKHQRKRTCKAKTLASLESRFLDRKTDSIDEAYLNGQIMLMLDNERGLYDAMRHSRRKPEALAWEAFLRLAEGQGGDSRGVSVQAGQLFPVVLRTLRRD